MKRIIPLLIILISTELFAENSQKAAAFELAKSVNILWVVISAALVFFMQAGFLMLESGLVRAKNTINVAIKNMVDFIVGSLGFYIIGFGIMFGTSFSGYFGYDIFMLDGIKTGNEYAFFLFQVTFMGTAATIVSGAVAERIKFSGYVIASIVISILIYPVFGHWAWGGGWLSQMGFLDFAGSTVVHSLGGWVGLAGIIVLGPRIDKFDENGKPREIYGHDLPQSVLGALILWLGWYGFNGGSTLSLDDSIPLILVNTSLSASAGGATALVLSWFFHKKRSKVEDILNGVIGGLVGITAGCNVVGTKGAVAIGIVSGIVIIIIPWIMENIFRLDDVIGAFAVHTGCGIWGTLAVPLFATDSAKGGSFLIQLLGVAVCGAWAFTLGFIVFKILKTLKKLRVPQESEINGLNVSEHGAKTTWLDLIKAMDNMAHSKGLPEDIPVEHGTESGMVASLFNKIRGNIASITRGLSERSARISNVSGRIQESTNYINESMTNSSARIEEMTSIMENINTTFQQTGDFVHKMKHDSEDIFNFSTEIKTGFEKYETEMSDSLNLTNECNSMADTGAQEISIAVNNMKEIQQSSVKVNEILNFLSEISDQLNMLSLNAAIEAARAGSGSSGFAIVAQEINKLADITKKQTADAAQHLKSMEKSVRDGQRTIETSAASFYSIKEKLMGLNKKNNGLRESCEGYSVKIISINDVLSKFVVNAHDIYEQVKDRIAELGDFNEAISEVNESILELSHQSESLIETIALLDEESRDMCKSANIFGEEKTEKSDCDSRTLN